MTFDALLEKHQFLAGAVFTLIGACLSFLITWLKEWIVKRKADSKEYDNLKMNIYAEMNGLNYELCEAVRDRDLTRMEYIDELEIVRANRHEKRSEDKLEEKDIIKARLDEHNKIVKDLKNKFVKQAGIYLYKKKMESVVTEFQMQLTARGLRYQPQKFSEWKNPTDSTGIAAKIKFLTIREKEYNTYHLENVVFPIAKILNAIRNDK